MHIFNNFKFDAFSFIIGLVAGSLFWYIVSKLKQLYPEIRNLIQDQIKLLKKNRLADIEEEYRKSVYLKAQRWHLSSTIFSLDEIVIPPKVIVENNVSTAYFNESDFLSRKYIPTMPDWAEFSSRFSIPKILLSDAINDGKNSVLIGKSGSGKTVSLAYLASRLAKSATDSDNPENKVPVLLSIQDFNYTEEEVFSDFKELLLSAIINDFKQLHKKQLTQYLTEAISDHKVILLLDGLDELPKAEYSKAVNFLAKFSTKLDQIQILTTSSTEYLDGILRAQFVPLSLAAWNEVEVLAFLDLWRVNWDKLIHLKTESNNLSQKTPTKLLHYWLTNAQKSLTPLEHTLIIWGAYSGDIQGESIFKALMSHFERILEGRFPENALILLASDLIKRQLSYISKDELSLFFSNALKSESSSQPALKDQNLQELLDFLVSNGILKTTQTWKYSFFNPLFTGYLASRSSAEFSIPDPSELIHWSAETSYLRFLTIQDKTGQWVEAFTSAESPPLYSNLTIVTSWLGEIPTTSTWRSTLMRRIVQLLQNDSLPFNARCRLIAALVSSNDQTIPLLLKQMVTSKSSTIRRLAALGSGAVHDVRLENDLNNLLSDSVEEVKHTACLSLASYNSRSALEAVTRVFVNGDENSRLIAAEALSQIKGEGYEILKDAITLEDIVLRRAAVFGLSRINEPWVTGELEKIAVEDSQWVVRNAAAQSLELRSKLNAVEDKRVIPPLEQPWLLEFAANLGVSVSPEQNPASLLTKILTHGTFDEKLKALEIIKSYPDHQVEQNVYTIAMSNQNPLLTEIAMNCLWYLQSSN